jgi:hypothetical protein
LEAVEIIGRLGGHRVLSNPKPAVYNPQLLWIYLVGRLADGNGKSRSSDKTLAASCGEETVMQTELQLRGVAFCISFLNFRCLSPVVIQGFRSSIEVIG